jgi:hypothetical protein
MYRKIIKSLFYSLCLTGCATGPIKKIVVSDDIKLNHDQVLICGYVQKKQTLRCMTPEEAEIRILLNGK